MLHGPPIDRASQGWARESWKMPVVTSRATSERTVLGRYVLGPAIGRGATAVVRRARDGSPATTSR